MQLSSAPESGTRRDQAGLVHRFAALLNRTLETASPAEVIAEALLSVAPGRLAVVSSFGTESAVLLKHVAEVDRSIPVLFIDTGWLFEETLAYRDTLTRILGLSDVRTITPRARVVAAKDPDKDLWSRDSDACCALRKVDPLANELDAFDAWVNGRKRYQGGERGTLDIVEVEGPRLKFNPLARVTRADIEATFEDHGLPRHPLETRGFGSIGCMPCTRRLAPGETMRAGRWGGQRTECGIHTRILSAAEGG
jgi:phosphoadenosine phosphosulfate reductase